jgi:hypothetical protein
MARNKSKGDVCWNVPNKKRPIAYSTVSDSAAISLINEPNKTPNELKIIFESGQYIVNPEMKKIIQTYIDKGYGDEILHTRY